MSIWVRASWIAKVMRSTWKVSCQEAGTCALWTIPPYCSTGEQGWCTVHSRFLGQWCFKAVFLVLPQGSPNRLGSWPVLKGRQNFFHKDLLIFSWGWGLDGVRKLFIYMANILSFLSVAGIFQCFSAVLAILWLLLEYWWFLGKF